MPATPIRFSRSRRTHANLGRLAVLILAIPSPASAADVLACEGPFARDSSHAKLEAIFGKKNVAFEEVPGPEGSTLKATIVFGKDEARRVQVTWHDEAKRSRPADITPGSAWRLENGLKPGMGIAEVETMNGRPFSLSGFEWDYGGYVTDWKGGALAKLPGGCNAIVRFASDDAVPLAAHNKVMGDGQFASNAKAMRAVRPRVGQVSVGYPNLSQ